jgi:CheY-like chemotaxis protein
VSDIRMPALDGPGFYRVLAQHDPCLVQRVIFLTGDTLSPGTRGFLEQSGVPCLSKPFALSDIRNIVQRVLQAREAPVPAERSLASEP